jgi:hypothetical protein
MAPGVAAVAENVKNNGAAVRHKMDIFLFTRPPLQFGHYPKIDAPAQCGCGVRVQIEKWSARKEAAFPRLILRLIMP